MNKASIIKNAISSEKKFCEGFFSSKNLTNYLLGINLSTAKVKKKLSHPGSTKLDKTNAFDLAETTEGLLGQINMMTVSSFCGPKGLIWGYDICKVEKKELATTNTNVKIYNLEPLIIAFKKLTGTVTMPHFPFLPGSHVPCANKSIFSEGEKTIYASLGIGIPKNRDRNACLLMEDIGVLPQKNENTKIREIVLRNLIKSVLEVGKNQLVNYKEIFVGIKSIKIKKGEIGCALAAAPYFTLAQNALPSENNLKNISLSEWENFTKNKFFCNN